MENKQHGLLHVHCSRSLFEHGYCHGVCFVAAWSDPHVNGSNEDGLSPKYGSISAMMSSAGASESDLAKRKSEGR